MQVHTHIFVCKYIQIYSICIQICLQFYIYIAHPTALHYHGVVCSMELPFWKRPGTRAENHQPTHSLNSCFPAPAVCQALFPGAVSVNNNNRQHRVDCVGDCQEAEPGRERGSEEGCCFVDSQEGFEGMGPANSSSQDFGERAARVQSSRAMRRGALMSQGSHRGGCRVHRGRQQGPHHQLPRWPS